MKTAPLYDSPEVYDVAFGWDLTLELEFVEACFLKHVIDPVRRIVEPACGTGRILAALAGRGYEVLGYDRSPEMVAFANAKLKKWAGRVMRGEMATFHPPGTFDAAINLVNSIGYLLDDEAMASHLACVAEAVRPGGVYLVQLSYAGEPPEQACFGPWPNSRAGLRTELTWRVVREDPVEKRSHQLCRIIVTSGQERRVIEESHLLRCWTQEDFDRLIEGSAFELTAVYYDRFEEKPLEEPRTGLDGNLYHVLLRKP